MNTHRQTERDILTLKKIHLNKRDKRYKYTNWYKYIQIERHKDQQSERKLYLIKERQTHRKKRHRKQTKHSPQTLYFLLWESKIVSDYRAGIDRSRGCRSVLDRQWINCNETQY